MQVSASHLHAPVFSASMSMGMLPTKGAGALAEGAQCHHPAWIHQVHPATSSAVSEASSLAAFDSEAGSPAACDKRNTGSGAAVTSEIMPAEDVGQSTTAGGKMRQLTPELAPEGVPLQSWFPSHAQPCCLRMKASRATQEARPPGHALLQGVLWKLQGMEMVCRPLHGCQPTWRLQPPGASGWRPTRARWRSAALAQLPSRWSGRSCWPLAAGTRSMPVRMCRSPFWHKSRVGKVTEAAQRLFVIVMFANRHLRRSLK